MGEECLSLNPHLLPGAEQPKGKPLVQVFAEEEERKRIRQETKPLLNKLETDWGELLKRDPAITHLRPQSLRLKIANGAWYKPDWTGLCGGRLICWECKGPKQVKGCGKGLLTLKVAARTYPEIGFVLVWREGGSWYHQEVLP